MKIQEPPVTESGRFAGRILAALGDIARVKYSGPDEDGTLLVVSERETGLNFTLIVSHDTEGARR